MRNQCGNHRIPLDVALNSTELGFISYHPVEVFFLPERLAYAPQEPVCQERSSPLDLTDQHRKRDLGCPEDMDVIRHDDKGVQGTQVLRIYGSQLFPHYACDL